MSEAEAVASASDPIDVTFAEDELDARRDHIASFVRDQVDAAGVDEVVIGLSGGVDSSLTAALAVEALGADAVYGLVMPSEVNREDNMSDAERLADGLGIEYDTVPIGESVESVLGAYPDARGDRVAVGNLRVRLRAVLLYLAANTRDALVLGTGNRSEALVGYFTKYGDGAVDCHPIANLYKGQVRQLAAHLGVPEAIAGKEASAEMWAGQTDAEELGLDYPTLDSILALHVEAGLAPSAVAAEIGVDESVVEHVRDLYAASEHKRHAPPGPDEPY